MKKPPAPLLTGLVAVVAMASALSIGAYGPDASALGAGAVPPIDDLWPQAMAAGGRAADDVVSSSNPVGASAATALVTPDVRRARAGQRADGGSQRSLERPDIGALAIDGRVHAQGRQPFVG